MVGPLCPQRFSPQLESMIQQLLPIYPMVNLYFRCYLRSNDSRVMIAAMSGLPTC